MADPELGGRYLCSIIIPCYNEEKTLAKCVHKVLAIQDASLSLEIIIVDDGSTDGSRQVAEELAKACSQVVVLRHEKNQGKGAALRTGFQRASGDFVAIQDADLEYNPVELKRLLLPLVNGEADVVFGSRFLASGVHRVLYFWHSLGNTFLTFFSNMCTDLNLTDMETCYKVFRREVVQSIEIEESRFGVEPELVAKVAHMRLRLFEMGISYYGRTYEEGKKIGVRDGFRALYCILHYNGHKLPAPMQFLIYLFIGGVSAAANIVLFLLLWHFQLRPASATIGAFTGAAILNYLLCISLLFRHKARWNSLVELLIYLAVVVTTGMVDLWTTSTFLNMGLSPGLSKALACSVGLFLNFFGRRRLVFPEPASGPWKPQHSDHPPDNSRSPTSAGEPETGMNPGCTRRS